MTSAELIADLLDDLGDDPTQSTQYYSTDEVLAALNVIQRLFVLMTLCLEVTATFALATDGTASYDLLETFADWIVPLRVRISGGGAKVRPATLADLAALNDAWRASAGAPQKYVVSGFALLSIYQQPSAATSIDITYARAPVLMTQTVDPEIPLQYHPALIHGAIPYLRVKEGAQEWQKVLGMWSEFTDAAQECAAQVRARNQEMGYDTLPAETARFDASHFMKRGN